jgi:hypothetical protein
MTRFTLAVSAAISLFAASGVAHSGEVISDQRYWPHEAYGYGYYAGRTHPPFNSMASMGAAPSTGSSFIYRGGPKTGTRDYNYTREW